jgi:hypothetical protein
MGLGSLVTGLAIYKPSQAHLITQALGGYEMAQVVSFLADDGVLRLLCGPYFAGGEGGLEQFPGDGEWV